MIKFTAQREDGGTLYGFGLTEANLNRLEFNNEPIFFDFGYASHPSLFGLIVYCRDFQTPEEIAADLDAVKAYALPFFNEEHGVTPNSLRFFPIAQSVMQKFRSTPFWGYDTHIEITHPSDMQIVFSGPDEEGIKQYFVQAGFVTPKTKQTYKGFGKRGDRNG